MFDDGGGREKRSVYEEDGCVGRRYRHRLAVSSTHRHPWRTGASARNGTEACVHSLHVTVQAREACTYE